MLIIITLLTALFLCNDDDDAHHSDPSITSTRTITSTTPHHCTEHVPSAGTHLTSPPLPPSASSTQQNINGHDKSMLKSPHFERTSTPPPPTQVPLPHSPPQPVATPASLSLANKNHGASSSPFLTSANYLIRRNSCSILLNLPLSHKQFHGDFPFDLCRFHGHDNGAYVQGSPNDLQSLMKYINAGNTTILTHPFE